jgi:hypothetical protein
VQTPEQKRISELERKQKDAEIERDILKNRHLSKKRSMIYTFIRKNEKIRLKRCAKYYKLSKKLFSMEKEFP